MSATKSGQLRVLWSSEDAPCFLVLADFRLPIMSISGNSRQPELPVFFQPAGGSRLHRGELLSSSRPRRPAAGGSVAAEFACPSMTTCCRHRRICCARRLFQVLLDVSVSDYSNIRIDDKPGSVTESKASQHGVESEPRSGSYDFLPST